MFLLLAHLALAADATRCVARWAGAENGCAVPAELTVAASGSTDEEAERAARRRLSKVMERNSATILANVPYRSSAEFMLCDELAESTATVSCTEDLSPESAGACFVEFDDPDCWNGDVLVVDDYSWQSLERGQRDMCARVDARLVALKYSNLPQRRADCQASCATHTTVRCPTAN